MRAGSCSTCMLHSMGERSIGLWRVGGHEWLRARCQSGRFYTLAMRSCPVWLVVSKHLPRMRIARCDGPELISLERCNLALIVSRSSPEGQF